MTTTWKQIEARLRSANNLGEEISELHGEGTLPVNPFLIARSERPLLKLMTEDFRDAFDGQLEYHKNHNRFILFLNTKYDAGLPNHQHHPRTRFSLRHELGHYFLDSHRGYLMGVGKSHGSTREFRTGQLVEREADAFAAGLLMPSRLARPIINQAEPSIDRILNTADRFQTSVVSTAIRTVQLSDFPCGIVGIRNGQIAWTFPSQALIDAGCYPGERGGDLTANAAEQWERFRIGISDRDTCEGRVRDWFRTYDREHLELIYLTEAYFPVPVMDTLLVLLTLDESDLFEEDDEDLDD